MLTESLDCQMTDEELRAAGDELATTIGEIEEEENAKASEAAEHNAAIKRLDARAKFLATKIRTKTEIRDVEVKEFADYEDGVFYTVRQDTQEKIHSRKMTDKERQRPLPLEEGAEERVPPKHNLVDLEEVCACVPDEEGGVRTSAECPQHGDADHACICCLPIAEGQDPRECPAIAHRVTAEGDRWRMPVPEEPAEGTSEDQEPAPTAETAGAQA